MLKISVVTASQREDSKSKDVADRVCKLVTHLGFELHFIDLRELALPFWGTSPQGSRIYETIRQDLQSSDAFIFLCPEWTGMATPMLKNFFLYTSNKEVGHKPGLAIAVSSGISGTYSVMDMQMFGCKNNHLVWIPEQVIIRHVESFLKDYDRESEPYTKPLKDRLKYGIQVLAAYGSSLRNVRESGTLDWSQFSNGM